MIILTVLLVGYIKVYAHIFPEGTHYRHYRKGRLIRQGSNGGMVIRIPFLDHVEIVGIDSTMIDPLEKSIVKEQSVRADIDDVWNAWTTEEGVKTFFAPDAKVELRINGPYELYFDLDAVYGQRGGEGLKVLSYLPKRMLSFEWNAPPQFRDIRKLRTWVVMEFQIIQQGQTHVTLTHCGWREGSDWDEVYRYFERAWDIVMDRFRSRFDTGPVDWQSL